MKLSQILQALTPDQIFDLQALDVDNRYAGKETSGLDFIYGDLTLVFSGPPLLAQAQRYPELLFQVGATTSLSVSQRRSFMEWDEFGFKYIRSIPGKITNSMSMEKIHTNQNNILSALYSWLVKVMDINKKGSVKFNSPPGVNPNSPDYSGSLSDYADQLFNFASEMFCIPFGLFIVQLDGNLDIKLTRYAELCKIPEISESFSSNPISSENISIMCTRFLPAVGLKVSTVAKKPYTMPGPDQAKFKNSSKTPVSGALAAGKNKAKAKIGLTGALAGAAGSSVDDALENKTFLPAPTVLPDPNLIVKEAPLDSFLKPLPQLTLGNDPLIRDNTTPEGFYKNAL